MKTILSVVFNLLLGVLGTAILASQISSGQSVNFNDGFKLNLRLYNFGLILYIVFLVGYFWGAKKYLGKSVGALLTEKILGKKK